jgi:hypothetical protein
MRIRLSSKASHRALVLALIATTAFGTAEIVPFRAEAALPSALVDTHAQGFADLIEQVGPAGLYGSA